MASPIGAAAALLADFSLGTGELDQACDLILAGTRLHVGFRDMSTSQARVDAIRAIRQSGFTPVPVIPARRLESEGMLGDYLDRLDSVGGIASAIVVGGDPPEPRGPFPDAASVIESGILEEHAVAEVILAGHPGGHPAASDDVLWRALAAKTAILKRRGLRGAIITQFGFDAAQVLTWLAEARARGITVPVQVGVPGPATVRRLLWYASRCDVTVSESAARAYGLRLTDTAAEAGPDRFIDALASGYDPQRHGEVKLHFNTFSGFRATATWISRFRAGLSEA